MLKKILYFLSRFKTMTIRGLLSRIFTILQRYGIFADKFANAVIPMTKLCIENGVQPTFPSTASAVARQSKLFQEIQLIGADLAIHGYRHLDYTLLEIPVVETHYKEAINIFNKNEIQFTGYRFPYLRRDSERIDLLEKFNLNWDSSEVIAWSLIKKENMTDLQWAAFQKILTTYEPQWIYEKVSLPYNRGGLIEIPVSVPDDDILIERIKLSKNQISKIWQEMLRHTAELNEMVVLQLHPERYHWFDEPLKDVLELLKNYSDMWKASLSEIARWWDKKLTSKVDIQQNNDKSWLIQTKLMDNVSLLVRNLHLHENVKKELYNGFLTQNESITIQSEMKPIIGIHSECDAWIQKTLFNDGFSFEISNESDQFNCFIDKNLIQTQRQLIDFIDKCKLPLIQIWRWPDNKTGCFCVSGDIDGTTLIDFWDRIYGRV